MAWRDDFMAWCEEQRGYAAEQLEEYKAGRRRAFHNDVDVSDRQIAHFQKVIEDMDTLVARARRDAGD